MIWQLIVRVLDVPTYIFPAPTDVVARGYRTDQPEEGPARFEQNLVWQMDGETLTHRWSHI
jgi:ABC-type nitrate/sulfonate/bicarbonate transport system permease component